MTPKFALAVDPIFLYVLEVLDRIGRSEAIGVEQVRDQIENRFREADAQLSEKQHHQGWELAKYALVAWIDDVLIEAPWSGRDWWENNSLEFAYFNTRDRATEFFKRAKEASQLTRRDSLEVFYVCVVLGFRGLYGLEEGAFIADQLELPPDIESWARRTAKSIQLGQGRPTIDHAPRPGDGAPPLEGKFAVVGASFVTVVLVVFTAVIGYFTFFSQG